LPSGEHRLEKENNGDNGVRDEKMLKEVSRFHHVVMPR
jgi:hypothetical protein